MAEWFSARAAAVVLCAVDDVDCAACMTSQ